MKKLIKIENSKPESRLWACLALNPLFFIWLLPITFKPQMLVIRNMAWQWGLVGSFYLASLILLLVLTWIPYIGHYTQFFVYGASVILSSLYLGLSITGLYQALKHQKSVSFPIIEKWAQYLAQKMDIPAQSL